MAWVPKRIISPGMDIKSCTGNENAHHIEFPVSLIRKQPSESVCRSFDLMKAVLSVKAAEDFELHMCPTASCGSARKRPHSDTWSLDHRCQNCNAKIYKVEAGHLRPVKR
jgi:hypothetical protein